VLSSSFDLRRGRSAPFARSGALGSKRAQSEARVLRAYQRDEDTAAMRCVAVAVRRRCMATSVMSALGEVAIAPLGGAVMAPAC